MTDGFEAGSFKLKGTRDLNFYDIKQIKRVRIVKRADGYYAQFCVDVERKEKIKYTGTEMGIDVGLSHFLTTSNGEKVDNPRHLRASEKRLKKSPRRMSSGTVVKKSLSVRTHCCPACKTILDRDENAAINILMRALEILSNTAGHAEINAQEQSGLCSVGEILLDKPSGKTCKGRN